MISMSRLTCDTFNRFKACLYSGSGTTVLKQKVITAVAKLRRIGKVCLRGEFGHAVQADLIYVPGLNTSGRGAAPELIELCAITNKLAGVDALLTPSTLEILKQILAGSADSAVYIVGVEQVL